jgi:hypothetical protein
MCFFLASKLNRDMSCFVDPVSIKSATISPITEQNCGRCRIHEMLYSGSVVSHKFLIQHGRILNKTGCLSQSFFDKYEWYDYEIK